MSGLFLANPKCQKIMLSFVFKDIINYEITYSFVRSSGHPAVRMFLTEAPAKTLALCWHGLKMREDARSKMDGSKT